jgi:ATP-dependent Zn protease
VNPSSTLKTIMFWLFIIMLAVLLWTLVSKSGQSAREEEPSYSEFMAQVDRGNVKDVVLYLSPNSYEIEGEWREPSKKFRTTIFKESAPDLAKTLRDKQVLITVKEVNRADWVTFLLNAAPLFLAGGLLDLHDAADAGGRKQSPELRQIPGAPSDGAAKKGDVQGRGRHG